VTHPFKAALAAVAAGALLAGCSGQVDLIARRNHYDAYLDMAARGQAVVSQDAALQSDLLQHTNAADQAPYPALQAEVDAMQRQSAALDGQRARLTAFEQDYDAFTSTQPTVGPKDPAWPRYSGLEARFQPIGAGVRQALQAVNASHLRYQAALADAGVARVDAAALHQEIADFQAQLDRSLGAMEQGLRDGRHQAASLGNAGGDGGWQRRHTDVQALEQSVGDAEDFRRQAAASALALGDSLPPGILYFGPGMDGGDSLAALRHDEESLRRFNHDFQQQQSVLAADCQLAASAPQQDAGWQGPAMGGGYAAGGAGAGPAAGGYAGSPAALQRQPGASAPGGGGSQGGSDHPAAAPGSASGAQAPQAAPTVGPAAAEGLTPSATADKPGRPAPRPRPASPTYGHGKAPKPAGKPKPEAKAKPDKRAKPQASDESQRQAPAGQDSQAPAKH
jgi:hypothetical protein